MRLSEFLQPQTQVAGHEMRLSEFLQEEPVVKNSLTTPTVKENLTVDLPGRLDAQPLPYEPGGFQEAQAYQERDIFAEGNQAAQMRQSGLDAQQAERQDQIDTANQQAEANKYHYQTNALAVEDWIASLPDHVPGESGERQFNQRLYQGPNNPLPPHILQAFQQLHPSHQQELWQALQQKIGGQLPELTPYQSAGAGMGEGYQGLKKAGAGLQELMMGLNEVGGDPSGRAQQTGPAPGADLRDSANTELRRLAGTRDTGEGEVLRGVARAGTTLAPAAVLGPAAGVLSGPAAGLATGAAVMGVQGAGRDMEMTRDIMIANGQNPDDARGRRMVQAILQGVAEAGSVAVGGPGFGGAAKMGLGMGVANYAGQVGRQAVTNSGEVDPGQSLEAVIQGLLFHYLTHIDEIEGAKGAGLEVYQGAKQAGKKAVQWGREQTVWPTETSTTENYQRNWRPGMDEYYKPAPDWPFEEGQGRVVPEPPPAPKPSPRLREKPLTEYSVAELRDIAAGEGIGIPKTLKKSDIVEAIERAERERQPTGPGYAAADQSVEAQAFTNPDPEMRTSAPKPGEYGSSESWLKAVRTMRESAAARRAASQPQTPPDQLQLPPGRQNRSRPPSQPRNAPLVTPSATKQLVPPEASQPPAQEQSQEGEPLISPEERKALNAPLGDFEQPAEPEVETQAAAGRNKLSRQGVAYIPNLPELAKSLRTGIRGLRERYAEVESKDSPRLAYGLTLSQQAGTQAETMISAFEKKAFGEDKDSLKDFYRLGLHYRGDVLGQQGHAATGVPRLTPQEQTFIQNNIKVRRAIDLWNRDIAPTLESIRTRHGLPMSSHAGNVPFFLNLPSEFEPTAADKKAINAGQAFSKRATGEGEYMSDPHEALTAILRGHLRTDSTAMVREEIRKLSINKNSVVDPSGARSPAQFDTATKGQPFTAKYKGEEVEVAVVDLNKDDVDPVYYPGTKKVWWYPPELHYVPKRVADAWDTFRQSTDPAHTMLDKTINGFTRLALVGDFAPHSLRVLFHVAGRLGQSGHPASVVPWYGSIPATVVRMVQMRGTPLGEAMQILIDRAGANRGHGYGLRPVKNNLLKIADIPHQLLMNPEYGVDPLARRAVARAYLIEELGTDFINKLEDRLEKNQMAPAAAAAAIQAKLQSKGMLAMGRRVNSTLGFSNRQTRSNLLNNLQRWLPFLSSQSGMIPGEIRKLLTLNLNPKGMGQAVKRGDYLRALLILAGSLATGAAGTYLMSHGLNKMTTGHGMDENDERHKMDVALGNGWYVSNIDPTFDRASRITGLKSQANREKPDLATDVGRELTNESSATVNSAFRFAFMLASGKAPYFRENNQLADLRDGWWWPMGAGRSSAEGLASGDKEKVEEGLTRDIVQTATGLRLSKGHQNLTHAERLANEILSKDARALTPEERQRREARNYIVEQLRKNPRFRIGPETGIPPSEFKQVYEEARLAPVAYKLKHLGAVESMEVWRKMTPEEKQKSKPILMGKLTNPRTIFKSRAERQEYIREVSGRVEQNGP